MHSVLIVVEKPEDRGTLTQVWGAFLNDLQYIEKQYEAVQTLSENSWMLDLKKSSLSALHEMIHAAELRSLQYKTLFFEKEPQWIYSSKPPNHEENNEN